MRKKDTGVSKSSFFEELLVRYQKESGTIKEGSLVPYIEKTRRGEDLEPYQAYGAMCLLMSECPTNSQKADFLKSLRAKGESIPEIASFVLAIREMAEPVGFILPEGSDEVIGDTCGTGGGTLDTFNISTVIIFILAASGIVVAKHGNRAITSKCGSADVLEELGVKIDLPPAGVAECLSQTGIAFLYAPNFHKAFKNVQKVRKEILVGMPTVFNILGPLCNPAFDFRKKNTVQLLGVREPGLTRKMAEVLKLLNTKRALVVHGSGGAGKEGMDELSILGENIVSELDEHGKIKDYTILPEDFGFKDFRAEDLAGGDKKENAGILIDILKGNEQGAKRDIVVFNAAAGLTLGSKANDLSEGIKLATQLIDTGKAYKKMEQLRDFTSG